MAEAEERESDKAVKKGIKSEKVSKVTAVDLAKLKAKEQEQLAQATAATKKKAARVAGEDEYAKLVDVANTNRVETLVDAHSLSEAVEQLSVGEKETGGGDSHPERRNQFHILFNGRVSEYRHFRSSICDGGSLAGVRGIGVGKFTIGAPGNDSHAIQGSRVEGMEEVTAKSNERSEVITFSLLAFVTVSVQWTLQLYFFFALFPASMLDKRMRMV